MNMLNMSSILTWRDPPPFSEENYIQAFTINVIFVSDLFMVNQQEIITLHICLKSVINYYVSLIISMVYSPSGRQLTADEAAMLFGHVICILATIASVSRHFMSKEHYDKGLLCY